MSVSFSKRGVGNVIEGNVIYIVLLVLGVLGIFAMIWLKSSGAGIWGEYYSKEIVKIINAGKDGDRVSINVQKATQVALKQGLDIQHDQLFSFDSATNRVCVRLSKGGPLCYSYFNEVAITNAHITFGNPENVLTFEIVSKTTP
jgi:hypothetical protein